MSPDRSLSRRRDAALRCAPLADGRRDPLDPSRDPAPSTFGLSARELEAHAAHLLASGWSMTEIRQRLQLPAAATTCACTAPAVAPTPVKEAA